MMGVINMDNTENILAEYSSHPSSYLALNKKVSVFQPKGYSGIIAYRDQGRFRIGVAGISSPHEEKIELLKLFMAKAKSSKKYVIMVQCGMEDAIILSENGFVVNQLGSSYLKLIDNYTLSGSRFVKLRNKISRAKRAHITIKEVGVDIPANTELQSQIRTIDIEWLKKKKSSELEFLIGEIGNIDKGLPVSKRLFVACKDQTTVAYILYSRTYGNYKGWMHDLTRRANSAPVGVMEHINSYAMDKFKNEGETYLHFGFTPLADLDKSNENEFSNSRIFGHMSSWLSRHGAFIYPMETQLKYKKKWYPDVRFCEYIAFEGRFRFVGLLQFLKLTKII